jgi:hypothetical protein
MDVREHLPVGVADGEAGFLLFEDQGGGNSLSRLRAALVLGAARAKPEPSAGGRARGHSEATFPRNALLDGKQLNLALACILPLLVRARQDLQVSPASRRNSVLF